MSQDKVDVVIIGGGIAGSALAAAVARGGLSTVVLERSTEYADHVRGEFLQAWGVVEAKRLGLLDALLEAGAKISKRLFIYDEAYSREETEAAALPLGSMLPGAPGAICMAHPIACEALKARAESQGAQVVRGVSDVQITGGGTPQVIYRAEEAVHVISCRLIVGADGRESVVRRQSGMALHHTDPRVLVAGLLVDGVNDWVDTDCALGTEGDRMYYIFPQGDGRVRLYLGVDYENRSRLSGRDKVAAFLEGFRLGVVPGSEQLAGAQPAGPCAAFPMRDSWTDSAVDEGIALIGDAGGSSDPVIGQGLSIALRDARHLSETLLANEDWSVSGLAPYAQERQERMRRLRFCAALFTDCHAPLGPGTAVERRRRLDLLNGGDPDMYNAQVAMLCGPEIPPPETFTQAVRDRLVEA